jgi:S-adenosylmethionine hydrolase
LSRANLVTLLSDFGLRDTYVAQMKAVIIGLDPTVRLVDVTHEVEPGNVMEAALALESAWGLFPEGSVHLAVVDPGVGSSRAPLAVEAAGHFFVGPDNGLFSLVPASGPEARAVRLHEDFRPVSATFHGRDVFAPAAAHLALGRPLEELGEAVEAIRTLPLPEVLLEPGVVMGEIIHMDHFGNLVTNLRPWHLEGRKLLGLRTGPLLRHSVSRTYSDVPEGECLFLWNSAGRLEVACREGHAAMLLGLGVGDAVGAETD